MNRRQLDRARFAHDTHFPYQRAMLSIALRLVWVLVIPGLCQDNRLELSKQIDNLAARLSVLEAKKDDKVCSCGSGSNLIKGADGWTLAFKINAGVPSSAYSRWTETGSNDDDPITRSLLPCGCTSVNMTSHYCNRHYRSKLLDLWPSTSIDKVRVSVYQGGIQKAFVTFNGQGSTWTNWFSKERLLDSSWSDLASAPTNFFSIIGDNGLGRRFFINNVYPGCLNDVGWLVVKDADDTCTWGKVPPYTAILYSPNINRINYNSPNVGHADALAIWVSFKPTTDLTKPCSS